MAVCGEIEFQCNTTQRTHGIIITPLLRQNDITSFCHVSAENDDIKLSNLEHVWQYTCGELVAIVIGEKW